MPRVCCFLNLWKGGANRRTVTAFGWLVALAWTVWKNPQERTVLHGIRWFWSPFSWASSRRNKHIIWVFTKLCFVECLLQSQVSVTCPIKYHVYLLALLFKMVQRCCSLFKQYIFSKSILFTFKYTFPFIYIKYFFSIPSYHLGFATKGGGLLV